MERIEPAEPIDRIDPLDPMLRMEPEDQGERDEPTEICITTSWQAGDQPGISGAECCHVATSRGDRAQSGMTVRRPGLDEHGNLGLHGS